MKKACTSLSFLLVCILLLTACAGSERHERSLWYVATTGDDADPCTEDFPCLTVAGAFGRADADDKIIIAAGTYDEVAADEDLYVFSHIDYDIWITGAGQDETVIDLGNTYAGFYVLGDAHLRLEDLTVQNARGNSPGGCLFLHGNAVADLENVTLDHCLYGGIVDFSATATTHLTNVSITNTIVREPYGAGAGIYNVGTMTIEGGEISSNGTYGVTSSGNLEMSGTLLENNTLEGLYIEGHAALSNLTIRNNAGNMGHVDGLRIGRDAVANIADSEISSNVRGLYVEERGTLTMQNTAISDNDGWGILVAQGGGLIMDNVLIENNGGLYSGSAIIGGFENRGTVELRNSRLTQNENGGLWNAETGEIAITASTFDENIGGLPAIFNAGAMTIDSSLIANNSFTIPASVSDTAVGNIGELTITNSTISGNQGGGIGPLAGHLSLSYVTITENSQYGLNPYRGGSTIIQVNNVLIARNFGFGNCSPVGFGFPALPLSGTNIESEPPDRPDNNCGFPFSYSLINLHLGPLANNSGPTLTHALQPGSPAINAATGACPSEDQRTVARPFGAACDVGAFEVSGIGLSLDTDIFPTGTPEATEITVLITEDARCRVGPGLVYSDFDFFEPGQTTTVKGRSADSNWYYVEAISFQGNCWIGKAVLQFEFGPEILLALPVMAPLATPTPTLDPDESYDTSPTPCPTLINKPGSCK